MLDVSNPGGLSRSGGALSHGIVMRFGISCNETKKNWSRIKYYSFT